MNRILFTENGGSNRRISTSICIINHGIEALIKPLPEDVQFVYTKQHQTTGLQPPFEGPFRVAERLSRSTFKLEVGTYKDGTKRYEIRHANDLKLAHPKSLMAPTTRPNLGRPPTSSSEATLKALSPVPETPSNQFSTILFSKKKYC